MAEGNNNFWIDFIATLKKAASRKQIEKDAKNLGDIKVPLVGTLNKTKTRKQLKQDLSSLNGTVKLNGRVDKKGVSQSVQQAARHAQKQADSRRIQMNFEVGKQKLISDIQILGKQASKLFSNPSMSNKYNSLMDNTKLAKSSAELKSLRLQLSAFRSELKTANMYSMNLSDTLKRTFRRTAELFGTYGLVSMFTRQLRNAWTEAKELDSAMTDLARVNAEISRDGFPDYLDRVINKTNQLAVATKDYIQAVTTFSRAGYNLADSETLADMAVQLEKVGDMSAESASKALLSGLQGYDEIDGYGMDKLAEKVQALNDKIDIIGNTASITQKEVAEGIQAVGSVMSDANTSVDEFISLLAAGNRSVQDSNKVALAIRTSALRIRGCTVELQDMGEETEDVIESTSTLAAKIKGLTNINGNGGVDILEADGETFRSIYEIYDDISKVYGKMSDTDASALLDLIAGKHRSNQISAVLKNMSEANELLNRSLNATGTASEEYEIYLQSAETATERFGVAMTETYNNIIKGETVKALTNAGTAVLNFVNSWGLIESTLKGFLALGILKKVTTFSVAFKNSAVQAANFGNTLNMAKSMGTLTEGTTKYTDTLYNLRMACTSLTDTQLKQVLMNKNLTDNMRFQILQQQGLTKAQAEAKLVQMGLIQTTNAQTAANNSQNTSIFKLKNTLTGFAATAKNFIMSNKLMVGVMAFSAVYGMVSSKVEEYKQKLEETRQANIEAASKASEQADKLSDLYTQYTNLANIQTRTTAQEEEFRGIVEDITQALGSKTKALERLAAGTQEYSEALKEATQEELKSAWGDAKAGTTSAGDKLKEIDINGLRSGRYVINRLDLQQLNNDSSNSKALDIIRKNLSDYDNPLNNNTGGYGLKNNATAEELAGFYQSVKLTLDALEEFEEEDLTATKAYKTLNKVYKEVSDSTEEYINQKYNQLKLEYEWQNGIPQTEEAYQAMKESILEASGANKQFKETLENMLEKDFPELAQGVKNIAHSVIEQVSKNSESFTFTDIFSLKTESGEATVLSNLKDNINEITTAYQALSEATEEYRTTGSLSFSTIEKLMESGDEWLNYLTVEDGQLRINEQAYYDMAQAKLYELKVQALQNLSEQVKGLQNTRDAMKWVETQNYDTADSYKTLASEVMNETITELNAKKALAKTDAEKSYWQDTIDMYQQRAEQIDKMFDFVDMHGMLSGGESVLSDTLAQAQKTADLIHSVQEEIEDNGKISISTLQDIASVYPVLEKYVQDYMAGVEDSEANLIAQLNQIYEQDVNNYKSAWLLKAQYDRNFWVDFQNGSADVVNRLRDQYGVDLKNFASYAQAKQSITAKILEAQAKIVQADLYVMRKTTGDITRSAEVAGLTTDQKRNAQDMWTNWKDEYLNAKLNNQEYLITADQMAQNLEHAGGLNPSSAKDLAKTLYTNLMALGVDSGRGYIDGLRAELDGLDTSFETYTAQYADKVSLAFDDPVKLDSSKSDKDTKETFDWIKIRIQRLNELLDKLKTRADNTYASWTSRNTALAQAIDKTYEAINLQSQAYSRYMQEANSVGLSGYYKTLVQNGAIDISTISDENLKDQINEYQNWYEKAQDCLKTQEDLNAELNEFKTQQFSHLKSEYDAIRERTEAQKELIESQITLLSTANEYNSIRNKQSSVISQLQNERSALADNLNRSGIQMYTEEWYNLTSQVEDFDQQIVEAKKELLEINNLQFDNLKKVFEYNISTLESAYNLMENEISLLFKGTDYNNLRLAKQAELQMLDSELSFLTTAFNSFHVQAGTEQWYEMNSEITSIKEKIQDTQKSLMEIDTLQFNNIKDTFDFDISRIEHVLEMLQNETDLLEMKGLFVNQSYYDGMKQVTSKELETLKKEREQLAAMLQNTAYAKGTSEWNDMFSTLMEIDKEISSLTNNMEEFDITIRDLNWEVFEYLEESINRITDETEYLVNLLSKKDLFEKQNGNMTEHAVATLGLHATAYEVYKQQAQDYYEEVQELQKQLVAGAGKDVLEQYNEMVKAHQDSILAANDEKQAILDLIEEGYKAQLEALQKLIDKKKEQMQEEKSLYDYQKSIQEKTDNIASLEKQKTAYTEDDSEEAMSRIQKIKVQLEESKADLKETEYERYLSDTETMLDQLASDYEAWMNERLDNEDALLAEILGAVDTQSSNIMETLNNLATQYGTMISDNIYNVFGTEGATSFAASLTTAIGNAGTDSVAAIYSSVNAVNRLLAENSAITNGYITSAGEGINGNLGTTNAGIGNLNGTLGLTNQHLSDLYNNVGGLGNTLNGVGNNITGSINGIGNSITSAISGTQNAISSLLSQLIQASSASKVTVSTPTASYSHTPTTPATSTQPSSSSASGIFIHKVDSYPKNRLQIETSVVDRLKKFDFDSSFTARASYYSKLGGNGTYTGSSSQNTWMIRKMKEMGYQKGTSHAKAGYHWTQENGSEAIVRKSDGAMLVPLGEGDMVFNNESTKRLYELSQNPEEYFRKYNVSSDVMKTMPVFEFKMPEISSAASNVNTSYTNNPSVNMGDVNITCNEVQNAKQLLDEVVNGLIQSSRFEKALFASVHHAMTGKGTALDKLKYIKH